MGVHSGINEMPDVEYGAAASTKQVGRAGGQKGSPVHHPWGHCRQEEGCSSATPRGCQKVGMHGLGWIVHGPY
jgi:hypothetical protein